MTAVLFASCQPSTEDNSAVLTAEYGAIGELLMNQQDDWNDGDIGGLFSLILLRTTDGWRIKVDNNLSASLVRTRRIRRG